MNNNSSLVPAALFLGIAIALCGYFVSRTHVNAKKYDRYVTVKGLAEREVTANVAIWPLRITAASNDLNELQRKLERDTRTLAGFLKQRGFTDSELSIGSPNIQDTRALAYGGGQSSSLRYIAKTDFTVQTGDIHKVQSAMAAIPSLIGDGLVLEARNQWEPVQYLYTSLNDIKPEMIEEATKNAREVADKFAADSGSRVGKIKSANQGVFSITNRDPNTGHIKNVRIVTTIQYFLED